MTAEYEKGLLTAAWARCRRNHTAAATALSLTYDQFRHAVRRHELQGLLWKCLAMWLARFF